VKVAWFPQNFNAHGEPQHRIDADYARAAANIAPTLLAQRDELLAALVECADRLGIHMKHSEDLIAHMKAHKAINNAKEQA
jgi:hypothetical protein